jgi:hypothetical protein
MKPYVEAAALAVGVRDHQQPQSLPSIAAAVAEVHECCATQLQVAALASASVHIATRSMCRPRPVTAEHAATLCSVSGSVAEPALL